MYKKRKYADDYKNADWHIVKVISIDEHNIYASERAKIVFTAVSANAEAEAVKTRQCIFWGNVNLCIKKGDKLQILVRRTENGFFLCSRVLLLARKEENDS